MEGRCRVKEERRGGKKKAERRGGKGLGG